MTPIDVAVIRTRVKRAWQLLPVAATLALVLALGAALASTYIGHSPSPYGMCYARGGTIPCALAAKRL